MTVPDSLSMDDRIRDWRQGDCALGPWWFAFRVNPALPLTEAARQAADDGVDLAESEVEGFAVLTQTCDIVRSAADRPFLEVAPLVRVEAGIRDEVRRAVRPRYAFIPGVASLSLVADLDRVMTVEKAVAADWRRMPGCSTDEDARAFRDAVVRKHARAALPDDFNLFAFSLVSRLKTKHARQSPEGDALRALRQIRVRAAPEWDSDAVELTFWFLRHESQPHFEGIAWDSFLESWLNLVPPGGRFTSVDGLVTTLADMTGRDYVESDPLDLDHLSSRDT